MDCINTISDLLSFKALLIYLVKDSHFYQYNFIFTCFWYSALILVISLSQVLNNKNAVFIATGLTPSEKYVAAVAAYSKHGRLIGDGIGQTSGSILASSPLPVGLAYGYLTKVITVCIIKLMKISPKHLTFMCYILKATFFICHRFFA